MDNYSESEVEAIQKNYRHLFSIHRKELEQFWYPPDEGFDWLCLTTSLNPAPTYRQFQALDADLADLKQVSKSPEPDIIGSELAALAKKHGVGYSIGLNPWADYLLYSADQTAMFQEVVVIVGYNWYPLVMTNKALPNSPLYKDNPLTFRNGSYAFAFESFLHDGQPPLIFFTNIFPHFLEAGKPAQKGLSPSQRKLVGGDVGMRNGLIQTLEAINPDIRLRGLVTLGGNALTPLTGKKVGEFVRDFQSALESDPANVGKALPSIEIRGNRQIPWLPYYHPAARELVPRSDRMKHEANFSKLAQALLKRSRGSN